MIVSDHLQKHCCIMQRTKTFIFAVIALLSWSKSWSSVDGTFPYQFDNLYMLKALELATQGLGHTRPNPCVGCIVTDSKGNEVGQGWHVKAGLLHAEVIALKEASEKASGGTAYMTLEPCNHYGRTPPCTMALIR